MLSLRHDAETICDLNPATIQDALSANVPTFATLKKYQGQDVTKAVINACLIAVNEFFGEKSGLSDSQIEMVSEMLFEDYYYMNIADFKLCVKNGIKGRYGKVYGKVAPNDVMEWFATYCEERMNTTANNSLSEHGRNRKEENESKVTDEYALQQIKAIREALEGKWSVEEPNAKEWKVYYRSIDQYCRDNDINPVFLKTELNEKWTKEYVDKNGADSIDVELFMSMKEQQFLLQINDQKNAD